MSAKCPLCRVDLVPAEDVNGVGLEKELRCPKHGGRYIEIGMRMYPVPDAIVSNPPKDCNRIVNIYWDPETEKAVFRYVTED